MLAPGCKAELVQVPYWGIQCQAQPEIDSFTLEDPSLRLHCMLFFDDKIWGFPCARQEARPSRVEQNPVAPTALPPCLAASLPPPFWSSLSLSLFPHPSRWVTGKAANVASVIPPAHGTFQKRANHSRND